MVLLRDTAATPTGGLIHGVGFYSSDEEFVRVFAPFCEAGLRHGEPTVVRLSPQKADLVKAALDDTNELVFVPGHEQYQHPPGALAAVLDIFQWHSNDSQQRIRLLGELPPFVGLSADSWLRYEALVNRALGDLPLSSLCAYHTPSVPDDVRADLLRTHQVIASPDGQSKPNPSHETPDGFLTSRAAAPYDPMEDGPASIDLADPDPALTRHAVGALARSVGMDPPSAEDLLFSVNEVVTNAILHGSKPVTVRAWGKPRRVVVAIADGGAGPDDPFVGLYVSNPEGGEGGRGLWLTHQLCPETALSVAPEGFTVRLAGGTLEHD